MSHDNTKVTELLDENADLRRQLAEAKGENEQVRHEFADDPAEGERCQRCGRRYRAVWAANDGTWKAVVGSPAGLYCPMCFDMMCVEKGIYPHWCCYGPDCEDCHETIHRLQAVVDKPWLTIIRAERKRQDKKWGKQNHDDLKWLAILIEEVGELAEAILKDSGQGVTELSQAAAVCVAWLEAVGRREAAKKAAEGQE